MGSVRWLVLAAALAQAGAPAPPTNLRIVDDGGGCAGGLIGTPPNCVPAPPAPVAPGKQWRVIYSEEFSGTSLERRNSRPASTGTTARAPHPSIPARSGICRRKCRSRNGTAKLVAEPLTPPYASSACYQGQCTYKAGLVSTARPRADNGSPYLFPFTYGYVESRMKFPGTPGFFTAFWMLPTNPSYTYDTEIDIVEILGGYPDTVFMTYHYNSRGTSFTPNNGLHNNGACQARNYSTDWVQIWPGLAADLHRLVHRRGEMRPVQRQHDHDRERPDATDPAHDDRQPVGTGLGIGPGEPDARAPAGSGLHPHLPAAVGSYSTRPLPARLDVQRMARG